MSYLVPVNIQVSDVFSVIGFDGYTKVPGVTFPEFGARVWKDGTEQVGYTYAIAEIGGIGASGDYRFVFTPDDIGLWRAEVWLDSYRNRWFGEYDVNTSSMDEIYDLVKRALGLIHENIFIDETVYDANGQMTSGRVRLFNSKTDVDAATDGGSPPPGGTDPEHFAAYLITVVWEGLNQYKIFKQTLEP